MKKNPKPGYKLVETIFGKTEEIPQDWSFRKLSEIGEIVGGGTPDTTNSDYWNNGTIPWYTPADFTKFEEDVISESGRKITEIAVDKSATKKIPPGAILITTRATIGECKIIEKESAVNQGIHNLICHDDKTKYFVLYAIRFHKNRLLRLASGTTFPEITRGNMREISIPIPDEPNERKKIGEILQNTSNLIFRTQKLIEQTTVYKQSLMQEILIKGLGHTEFKKETLLLRKLVKIPEKWNVVKGDEIFTLSSGISPSEINFESQNDGDVLFVKVDDMNHPMNNKRIVTSKQSFLKNKNKEKKIFNKNDIIFPKRGIAILGNKVRILDQETSVDSNTMVLHCKPSMNVDFMYYQLLHLKLDTVMENAGIPQLNNKDLYPIFYLKPPLPEQEKIASILSNVDKKIEKEKQFKKQAQSYHRALMQKLLTGEKRVKF